MKPPGSELETAGRRVHFSDSDTARRLREAAFFPVQSPSLAQLRLELGQYEKDQAIEAAVTFRAGRGCPVIEILGAGKDYVLDGRIVTAFDGV